MGERDFPMGAHGFIRGKRISGGSPRIYAWARRQPRLERMKDLAALAAGLVRIEHV